MNTVNEHLAKLDTDGFTIMPGLLNRPDCEQFKLMLEDDYTRYSPLYANEGQTNAGTLANKAGEKVIYNLHNKHLDWFRLFEHKAVLPLLDGLLREGSYSGSEPYYLYNNSARCPLKGFPEQQLHTDSNMPGVNYCIVANVLWALDEFTLQNGATRVVPGSHRIRQFAADGVCHPDEVRITAPQGSAIIFNANLWHGGAENKTEKSRWAVALGYARWFIKPSFDVMYNTPDEIYAQMTDAQKKLLGFDLVPPHDEFTRLRRRADRPERPHAYRLPAAGRK
jgi:ectoine hydroxylase-related dioxygenase (phytanoyl-CoA dioxygenase family)